MKESQNCKHTHAHTYTCINVRIAELQTHSCSHLYMYKCKNHNCKHSHAYTYTCVYLQLHIYKQCVNALSCSLHTCAITIFFLLDVEYGAERPPPPSRKCLNEQLCGLLSGSELSLWANVWWAFVSPVSLELPQYIWTSVMNGQVYQTEMAGIELSNKNRSMHICDSAIHTFTHEYLHLCEL